MHDLKFPLLKSIGNIIGMTLFYRLCAIGMLKTIFSGLNPFGFSVFARRAGQLKTATFDVLAHQMSDSRVLEDTTLEVVKLVERSELFQDMRSTLRALHVSCIDRNLTGTTVVAQDLAVRNFGGKFGRNELLFDCNNRLVDEMAYL